MLKKKKVLLIFIFLFIISGILYKITYARKEHEKSVQTIKINEENSKIKKMVKEKSLEKARAVAILKAKEQVKVEKYKKDIKKRSGIVIVIDPGHASITSLEKEQQAPGSSIMKIKEPGGAQGINTKTPEYVVNMEVAVRLKGLLSDKGYTVIMTKTENKQMLGNIARAQIGNKAKADLVIRIHADSNNDSSIKGASMLVPADTKNTAVIYKRSKKYGEIVFNKLIKNLGMMNRGIVERDDMTGFNWSKVPIILVEMGFQSNDYEDKLLATGSYQGKIAKALSEGIDEALK